MDRLSEKFSKLEIQQMKSIKELQDKIKLLEFDIISNKNFIRELKIKIKTRDVTFKKAIEELENIIKNEDYKKINNVIFSLKSSMRRQEDIERCTYYE